MINIELPQTASTNSYMLDLLKSGTPLMEGTMVSTPCQTAGRGQMGNSWESEPYCNIAFSLLLHPTFLAIREQFIISEMVSLAVAETVAEAATEIITDADSGFSESQVSIKWPNDVYYGDSKIAGILIETRLCGSVLTDCVIGIGLNVNQLVFKSPAPNPVSMLQLVREWQADAPAFNRDELLMKLNKRIMAYYQLLKKDKRQEIHERYMARLYRREGYFPYIDATSLQKMNARIVEIEPSGQLVLEDEQRERHCYMFKEVKFVLPCGVTKE